MAKRTISSEFRNVDNAKTADHLVQYLEYADFLHETRQMKVRSYGVSWPEARGDITDRDQYQHYRKAALPVIEQYGGKVIPRSENSITLEGPDESRRIVILQFPSVERVTEFYSPSTGKPGNSGKVL